MSEPAPDSGEPWRGGCLIALAVFIAPVLLAAAWPRLWALSDEWPFLLLHGFLLALPFGYLALAGTKDWLPWSIAALLTVGCWGLLLRLGGPGLGAAIISFAIPVIVTAAAAASRRT